MTDMDNHNSDADCSSVSAFAWEREEKLWLVY